MPAMWFDVDVTLTGVPVNSVQLIDDTDFKTREESVVYNQAGLDLVWNFITSAGAFTQTVVTPTTGGGSYDWTNQGNGFYTISIPSTGGASINNDTEGYGWFAGYATGILPWVGPVIGFRAAGLNDKLTDSAYSATRGLAGTALPDAAADAAGGLPISDAGGLDMDTMGGYVGAILEDVTGINGAAMRGTDSAALASVCTEARLAELDAANIPADVDTLKGYCDKIDDATDGLTAIKAEVEGLAGAAMRGTDNAALASVCTEARLAELAAANLPADIDTLKTYCDILDDVTNGNAAIKAEVEGLAGAAMRGTDNAALASVCTEARLAELTAANLPADVDAIKAKTNNLPASPAAVGSEMALANDAITAAKFDESTAYPIKSADTGATQIARVGADGDTLETLSDQIDGIAGETPINIQHDSTVIKRGSE